MTEAPEMLEKAAATMRERSAERDTEKERAMAKTVAMFNAAFPSTQPMTEYQGWLFMFFLKLSRAHGGSYREDDYIDGAAYIALAGECREQMAEKYLQHIKNSKFEPYNARSSVTGESIPTTQAERSASWRDNP